MNDGQRRLLDMLAGWLEYVTKCEDSGLPHPGVAPGAYAAEADAISDLYQQAGALGDGKGGAATDEQVARFIELNIIPLAAFGTRAPS